MIPLTTKPGTEIVARRDLQPQLPDGAHGTMDNTPIVKGQRYTLARWSEHDCVCDTCGNVTIEVAEIDPRVRIGNVIIGLSSFCPSLFDLPVKIDLPVSITKFVDRPIDGTPDETFEEPKRVPEKVT